MKISVKNYDIIISKEISVQQKIDYMWYVPLRNRNVANSFSIYQMCSNACLQSTLPLYDKLACPISEKIRDNFTDQDNEENKGKSY